ncbi:MAG: HAMP domain-containing histidine kinase [Clostridia bacterium]|nr:HAMP domain-containing histidine kinase [Clostridia bacterium]
MIKKLRKKFILISIATVTSVMILLCAGVNIANFVSENSKMNSTIDSIIHNHGRLPEPEKREPAQPAESRAFMPKDERRFEKENVFQTRFFVIDIDSDGEITEYNLDKIAAVEEDDTDEFAETAFEHGEGFGYEDGYKFKVEKKDDGSYTAVFLDCHKEMNSARTLLFVSILVTVFCIALISIIIVVLSRRAMEPVIQNDLKQKQFITDASHELKTPITVINTSLSVLEMEVGKQKWIDKAVAQTEKLKNLVNSLVTLAKSDEEREITASHFNISDVVSETVESFADFAAQKQHSINANIENGIGFSGDEYAVRQLVSILIDNALKYASDGSSVNFSMKKHKKGVLIRSSNKCDSINDDDLPKLFDRFYRADKARTSENGGFGIGLSVARGICENHKGYIRAERTGENEIEFTAYLNSI